MMFLQVLQGLHKKNMFNAAGHNAVEVIESASA